MCLCLDWFLFFFFKQKTAYEMRISDWSSDVCSSDLRLQDNDIDGYWAALEQQDPYAGLARNAAANRGELGRTANARLERFASETRGRPPDEAEGLLPDLLQRIGDRFAVPPAMPAPQRGRASCSERGC